MYVSTDLGAAVALTKTLLIFISRRVKFILFTYIEKHLKLLNYYDNGAS